MEGRGGDIDIVVFVLTNTKLNYNTQNCKHLQER